ncbi:hypothetical protein ACJIZ3_025688 [Penstemon smallii]|uniref:Uncharacterized protein n=1 Tax=Penstemon smallii TaxID=265156 RepID=A0ABD3TVJ1_9LAMI
MNSDKQYYLGLFLKLNVSRQFDVSLITIFVFVVRLFVTDSTAELCRITAKCLIEDCPKNCPEICAPYEKYECIGSESCSCLWECESSGDEAQPPPPPLQLSMKFLQGSKCGAMH